VRVAARTSRGVPLRGRRCEVVTIHIIIIIVIIIMFILSTVGMSVLYSASA
jgi:hypothetical protein